VWWVVKVKVGGGGELGAVWLNLERRAMGWILLLLQHLISPLISQAVTTRKAAHLDPRAAKVGGELQGLHAGRWLRLWCSAQPRERALKGQQGPAASAAAAERCWKPHQGCHCGASSCHCVGAQCLGSVRSGGVHSTQQDALAARLMRCGKKQGCAGSWVCVWVLPCTVR